MTGRQRVENLLKGEPVDRQPLYDILRNDEVIGHFAGEPLTYENAVRVTRKAVVGALDATRGLPKLPVPDGQSVLPDGRKVKHQRWTRWIEPKRYESQADYIQQKRKMLSGEPFGREQRECAERLFQAYRQCEQEDFKDVAFFWNFGVHPVEQFGVESPPLAGTLLEDIYHELGLEEFSYLLYDNEAFVAELLEFGTQRAVATIEALPDDLRPLGILYADDIAFKTSTMVNPKFLEKHYFHRLQRIIDAIHAKGAFAFYHSDGNLNMVLDSLVDAGIDLLNPVERLAGMDVAQIHKRFPKLVMAGGIDVSQLLARGTPAEIREEVRKTMEDAEGRILIGSTTEIHSGVPLPNFLAMREAVGA